MREPNELQTNILLVVRSWADTQKSTIPRSEIIKAMSEKGVKPYTTINAIASLIGKGYLRKSRMIGVNQTFYVLIRNL